MNREGIALTRRRGLALLGTPRSPAWTPWPSRASRALGTLTFENRGLRPPGVPVQWDAAGETLLPSKA